MDGNELKQIGLDLVEENNESFVETMRRHARSLAIQNGSVTSDDLRAVATEIGLVPDSPNAWGAVFRGKCWRPVGYENSRVPSNHARVIRRWEYHA